MKVSKFLSVPVCSCNFSENFFSQFEEKTVSSGNNLYSLHIMAGSVKVKQKIRSVLLISFFGIIAGLLFVGLSFGFDAVHVVKAVTGGFIITFVIGLIENFIFQSKFRKLRFSTILVIRTLVYVLVISLTVIIVWVTHESSVNKVGFITTLGSEDFRYFILKGDFKVILIFAIVFSFLVNFFMQINNLLGRNVLPKYISGKYHFPVEELRTFMFLDLKSSTTIGEKLGPLDFHRFINSYFFDIDESIVACSGEVYQYVGDEVVISWKDKKGFKDSNCIRCFFMISDKIKSLEMKYSEKFGITPEFKAGLHYGKVITGEIGDSKKEIVFHGDVLNTAARIQAECNALNQKLIVSEEILNNMDLPSEFKTKSLGEFLLRGKEQGIKLYGISKE